MPRNYLNYSGQISQPFTVLAAFIKSGNAYQFEFDTWRSTADFNAESDPFPPLHRSVIALPSFASTNQTLLTQLGTLFLNEMGLGGRGYQLDDVVWMPIDRVLTLQAVKGEESATMVKRGAGYAAFVVNIPANLTAFQNLNAAVWTYAKANDPFFEMMVPAT